MFRHNSNFEGGQKQSRSKSNGFNEKEIGYKQTFQDSFRQGGTDAGWIGSW